MPDGTPRYPVTYRELETSADLRVALRDSIVIPLPDTVPQTALDIWGPHANRLHRVEGTGNDARGFFTVTSELALWTRLLPALDSFTEQDGGTMIGEVTAGEHCAGHFGGRLEKYKPFPGHYIERAAITTAGLSAPSMHLGEIIPVSIGSVDFQGIVRQGEKAQFAAEIFGDDENGYSANIRGLKDGSPIMTMTDARWRVATYGESDPLPLFPDEYDEFAIQALAVAGLGPQGLPVDNDGKPLMIGVFKKIVGTQYFQDVHVGDELQLIPENLMTRMSEAGGMLVAGAHILNQKGELVAQYKRMQAGFIPFAQAEQQLSS